MSQTIAPEGVKAWIDDSEELAFIDVREHGQYGEAHPFFVSSVPFSCLELRLPDRVPNRAVRMVLLDDGDGVAQLASERAQLLGYTNVWIMAGGAPAWAKAGYTLYAGVNVPSKAFAEVMELARHTPSMTAQQVKALQDSGADHIILDGRPLTEFQKMSIPGAQCCPNGELALRIGDLVKDDQTTIVINCAGRTRSIVGAQTVIDSGVPNPVFALENGTQGWVLAGYKRDHGATRQYQTSFDESRLTKLREVASGRAQSAGVKFVSSQTVSQWVNDQSRTTYLLDVRTPEEFAHDGSSMSVHAPGGQLVQGTDEWIGVRGARIVLLDSEGVRAPFTAYWLTQIGHDVCVLEGGVAAMAQINSGILKPETTLARLESISPSDLKLNEYSLIDLRGAMAYRQAHIDGAQWSVRPMVGHLSMDQQRPVLLIGNAATCRLVAGDLQDKGFGQIRHLDGDAKSWADAGLPVTSSPNDPVDAQCIDHLFFTAERHTGNEAQSRQYLDWELNLVNQLDEQERGAYRLQL